MDFFDNNQFDCGIPAVDCGYYNEIDDVPSIEMMDMDDVVDPMAFAPGGESLCTGKYAGIEMGAMAAKRAAQEAVDNVARGLTPAGHIPGGPLDTFFNAPGQREKLRRLFG
jgi:hypothetical protein